MRIRITKNDAFIESYRPKLNIYVDFNIYTDINLTHTIRSRIPLTDLLRVCYNLTQVLKEFQEHSGYRTRI